MARQYLQPLIIFQSKPPFRNPPHHNHNASHSLVQAHCVVLRAVHRPAAALGHAQEGLSWGDVNGIGAHLVIILCREWTVGRGGGEGKWAGESMQKYEALRSTSMGEEAGREAGTLVPRGGIIIAFACSEAWLPRQGMQVALHLSSTCWAAYYVHSVLHAFPAWPILPGMALPTRVRAALRKLDGKTGWAAQISSARAAACADMGWYLGLGASLNLRLGHRAQRGALQGVLPSVFAIVSPGRWEK